MAIRLTDTAIAKAEREVREAEKRRDLSDAGQTGLQLRLTPAGARSWVLLCRDKLGRLRRFPLGDYPTVSISDAREKARAMRQAVRHDGADPIAEGRRKRAMGKAALAGEGTLRALLDEYGWPKDAGRPANPGAKLKSWTESRKRVDVVFKPLLGKPVGVLTLGELQMVANRYPSAASAAFAVRTLRPVLRWAAAPGRSYVSADLGNLSPPKGVKPRTNTLSREALAKVLPALKASSRPYAAAMRFMLLTLCRREEAGAAKWGDINLTAATWTIRETKNGEPHVVPLSRQALALLRSIPRGKSDALVFATSTGGALAKWDLETKAIMKASKTEGWTRHDLRRTGATMLGEMGELPDIVEAALNHVSIRSTLAATYNRSRYRPQVAAALQRLADALDGIEAGAGEVVQLHRA